MILTTLLGPYQADRIPGTRTAAPLVQSPLLLALSEINGIYLVSITGLSGQQFGRFRVYFFARTFRGTFG